MKSSDFVCSTFAKWSDSFDVLYVVCLIKEGVQAGAPCD